ncbi:MAG: ABC transporter permease [Thermofilum sp.]|nr:ABC transporter permease [Thermofilum sp.]
MLTLRYFFRRSINALLTYVAALILVFFIPRIIPGSPEELLASSYRLPAEAATALRVRFGLDRPLFEQFMLYIKNVVFTFPPDFGISYSYYPAPVWNIVVSALPWTLFLLTLSTILTAILGTSLGILAAWKHGTKLETIISTIALFLLSTPHFWIAIIFIMIFGVYIPIFPIAGAYSSHMASKQFFSLEFITDVLWHAALPILSLVSSNFAVYTIVMRDNMISTMGEDYITLAEAKGLKPLQVVFKHAARNALLPVLTMLFLNLGTMVGGAIVIEAVFSYPGVGLLLFNAILSLDYPLIHGFFYIVTISVIVANYIADIFYALIDPRVRY